MLKKFLLAILLASSIIGTPAVLASPGNDSLSEATHIEVNKVYNGVVNNTSEKDFYTFTLNKSGNVVVSIPNKSGAEWKAVVYDSNGTQFKTFYTKANELATGETTFPIGLPAGKYYLHIETYGWGAVNVPYLFSVKFEESDFYEKEWNDTLSSANPILLNTKYIGSARDTSEKDFYTFTLGESGNVVVSIPNKPGAEWKAVVYDSNGTQFKTFYTKANELATGETTFPIGLPAGKYYLHIEAYGWDAVDVPYSFQVSFTKGKHYEKEWNDTLTSANPIELNYKYIGSARDTSEKDFYKFTLKQPSNILVSIANQENISWKSTLYDEQGNSIETFYTSDDFGEKNRDTKFLTKLGVGIYYLHIEAYGWAAVDVPYSFSVSTKNFNDVSTSFWAYNEITFLYNKGIIKGYDNNTFRPTNNVTKAQAATMIARALNLNVSNVSNPGFKDVSNNHSAYKEIAAVTNAGIFAKGTHFNPNAPLTRGEMARALVEAYDLKGTYNGNINDVHDAQTLNYVKILAANQITNIYSDGTFKPQNKVSRAHFSVFFARVLDNQFKN